MSESDERPASIAGAGDAAPIPVVEGSGNVFADLGFENPEEMQLKAALAARINEEIARRELTQARAAALLGVDQPKISALRHGRLLGFSIERLLRFVTALDRDVEIRIRPKAHAGRRGRVKVTAP
jgi:predicted XRE-type DNA-binding protein